MRMAMGVSPSLVTPLRPFSHYFCKIALPIDVEHVLYEDGQINRITMNCINQVNNRIFIF